MKEVVLISIIIPIYNVEKYLPDCVDSIMAQSYRDLEVILVDDGSTDRSGALCDDYARMDSRFFVIHKENGGLSDARNCGTEHATGRYIFYLDGDDWLAPNCLEILCRAAEENDVDIVQGGFCYEYDDYELCQQFSFQNFSMTTEQAMLELVKQGIVKNFAWGKLYKSELVKSVSFEKGKYYEDSFWKYQIIHGIKRYLIVRDIVYYYRQREGGISGQYSLRNIDLLYGTVQRTRFIKQYYPNIYRRARIELKKLLLSNFSLAMQMKPPEKDRLLDSIRDLIRSEGFGSSLRYRCVEIFPASDRLFCLSDRILARIKPQELNHYKRRKWEH